ncbi:MAG: phosphotransferase [Gammaproteobacteria bacterium]|nr:phosphotransferase [Gammaproteobacteria bacterium]
MQTREQTLNNWLSALFSEGFTLRPLAGDASFRRYYRLHVQEKTYVVMDAPPEHESLTSFLFVQSLLAQAHICVPLCLEKNIEQGFLLLSDFGDQLLLDPITPTNTQKRYLQALDLLAQLQHLSPHSLQTLPQFDAAHIHLELSFFKDWFLQTYLNLTLSEDETALLHHSFECIIEQLQQQPRVFIHRDYHSRNIMCLSNNTLGLIDFQDAMIGPLGYDLVSLLKDCYIQWPQQQVSDWVAYFHQNHMKTIPNIDQSTLTQCIDHCGLQRHLKVLGIFSRLAIRDSKPCYLQNLPLTLHYVTAYLETDPLFKDLYQFMQSRVKLP